MNVIKSLIVILFFSNAINSFAEIAVIVHPSNTATLSSSDITMIFLGKKSKFNEQETAIPLSLTRDNVTYKDFTRKALNKSTTQLEAYWAKRIFTGKGTPPKPVDDNEMIKLVAENPNAIGYIDKMSTNSSVKIIAEY